MILSDDHRPEVAAESASQREAKGDVALKVEKIRSPQFSDDMSFVLRRGEILGLWGLMGSGRTELVRAILGLDPIEGGSLFLAMDGSMVKIHPHKLLSHCGYITENRHADGLFLSQPVWRNITATALARYVSKVLRFRTWGRAEGSRGAHRILTDSSRGRDPIREQRP